MLDFEYIDQEYDYFTVSSQQQWHDDFLKIVKRQKLEKKKIIIMHPRGHGKGQVVKDWLNHARIHGI